MATVKAKINKNDSRSFEIRVSLGRDLNGKQLLKYYTWSPPPGMTQRQIDKALKRETILFEEKCRTGQVLDTSTKFADFAQLWLEQKKDAHSPAYQNRAASLLKRINAKIGHLKIGGIKQQAIFDNPAKRVEPPKKVAAEASFLDDAQAVEVVTALSAAPLKWRTLIMLLVFSGCRRGEAVALEWSDVDFTDGIIHITKARQYIAGLGTFDKAPKNESSRRVIKLPPEMFALFREHANEQQSNRLKMGDRWHDSRKVFTQENGLPMNPDSISGFIGRFRKAHNLPYFSAHTLRHTSATLLIMAGVPIRSVSARLGHASPITTNKVYSHSIKTVDAAASTILGDILTPIGKQTVKRSV